MECSEKITVAIVSAFLLAVLSYVILYFWTLYRA